MYLTRLDRFIENLQNAFRDGGYHMSCEPMTQRQVKQFMSDGHVEDFPMICSEYTKDSDFLVELDDSNFLNSLQYDHDWISIDDTCFLSFHENHPDIFTMDVFELMVEERGYGLAATLLEVIEECASVSYEMINVYPFDSSSELFWKHMGYEENDKLGHGLFKYIG